jgi:hypothetical protein
LLACEEALAQEDTGGPFGKEQEALDALTVQLRTGMMQKLGHPGGEVRQSQASEALEGACPKADRTQACELCVPCNTRDRHQKLHLRAMVDSTHLKKVKNADISCNRSFLSTQIQRRCFI